MILSMPIDSPTKRAAQRAKEAEQEGACKATTDPKISAALLDKAADLKLQMDEPGAPPDSKPLAPDIEPPAT